MQESLRLPGGTPPVRPSAAWRVAAPSVIEDVLGGLRETPKRLSPTYFYDEVGSQLFDQICELPEYYITRTETAILERHAREIAQRVGEDAMLVELGSGASTKTRLLLDRLPDLAAYVPVDISRTHLLAAARRISTTYPALEVLPAYADFTRPFTLPKPRHAVSRVVVFFPGSTIGNFDRPAAIELMRTMRTMAIPRPGAASRSGGGLLIGFDLVKDPVVLERAYNDAAGVTARFNLNILRRLNDELDAGFDLRAFRHRAIWVPEESRIEMRLTSRRAQSVSIAQESISFDADEPIITEHCHKYSSEEFARQAAAAGWMKRQSWRDPKDYFEVQYLELDPRLEPELGKPRTR